MSRWMGRMAIYSNWCSGFCWCRSKLSAPIIIHLLRSWNDWREGFVLEKFFFFVAFEPCWRAVCYYIIPGGIQYAVGCMQVAIASCRHGDRVHFLLLSCQVVVSWNASATPTVRVRTTWYGQPQGHSQVRTPRSCALAPAPSTPHLALTIS